MIDALASEPHYRAHIEPVWEALDPKIRGTFHNRRAPLGSRVFLVASYRDLWALGDRPTILLEHGAGQSYLGGHPAYAGGSGRDHVVLFCCPNAQSARLNAAAYPSARVAVTGDPSLEALRRIVYEPDGTVAVAFHWDAQALPETRWAWPHYRDALAELARHAKVIGHAHPRAFGVLAPWYAAHGIEPVADFSDVCRRAAVLVADNTSAMFEFAALGHPVVVLNAPWYRRDVNHGGRFWDWADVGVQVDEPEALLKAIATALEDPPEVASRRREITTEIYPVSDAVAATVDAITENSPALLAH